jgi:hypothetical protein
LIAMTTKRMKLKMFLQKGIVKEETGRLTPFTPFLTRTVESIRLSFGARFGEESPQQKNKYGLQFCCCCVYFYCACVCDSIVRLLPSLVGVIRAKVLISTVKVQSILFTIDMAIYLRQHMNNDALYLHVWSDRRFG